MNDPYPAAGLEGLISDFVHEVGPIPHQDYLDFMRRHAGGAGPAGSKSYITLWPLEEIVSAAKELGTEEYAPGLLLFGGDGGNEGFAFDRRGAGWPIVSVPLIGLSRKEAQYIAATFTEFIKLLAKDGLPA